MSDDAGSTRPRRLDPLGKQALFEAPVGAAPDTLRAGRELRGRDALFSVGPPERGTVVIECSACHARSRVGVGDIVARLGFSVWLPVRRYPHRIACPSCRRTTWCRVGWRE